MGDHSEFVVRVETEIADIDGGVWNALANPQGLSRNPFISHEFLLALEEAGCVGPGTGWASQHLILEDEAGQVRGIMPNYAKSHSQGEYVFDHGWADAFHRVGGNYYPKLLSAVPFTPVTGRRFLVGNASEEERTRARGLLMQAATRLTDRLEASSFHVNFLTEDEWRDMGEQGFLQRTDQQFHWENHDYTDFDAFLSDLASRKRKTVRKERSRAQREDIEIKWISGADITDADWDAFFEFYLDTGARKWGHPYLNRKFFSTLSRLMPDDLLLIMARRDGRYIAGALNLIGSDTLYGRYWGCTEEVDCLHFEICYYQAIDYAIEHKLKYVEAGAQGGHKLARGYLPRTTYSAHYIAHPGFRRAIEEYLAGERQYVEAEGQELEKHSPFKKCDGQD